jgi:hypothetical protein
MDEQREGIYLGIKGRGETSWQTLPASNKKIIEVCQSPSSQSLPRQQTSCHAGHDEQFQPCCVPMQDNAIQAYLAAIGALLCMLVVAVKDCARGDVRRHMRILPSCRQPATFAASMKPLPPCKYAPAQQKVEGCTLTARALGLIVASEGERIVA